MRTVKTGIANIGFEVEKAKEDLFMQKFFKLLS
jgi:hypothetical protein